MELRVEVHRVRRSEKEREPVCPEPGTLTLILGRRGKHTLCIVLSERQMVVCTHAWVGVRNAWQTEHDLQWRVRGAGAGAKLIPAG